jgi:endonuclease-3 related protein
MKRRGLMTARALASAEARVVEQAIRMTGFYRQKAARIQKFAQYVTTRHDGSIARLLRGDAAKRREELLRLDGFGPETADSVLLYVKGSPYFVIDSYTRRLFGRLGHELPEGYAGAQAFFHRRLPRDAVLYGEFHALIDVHCKTVCLPEPLCGRCPLSRDCAAASTPGLRRGQGY